MMKFGHQCKKQVVIVNGKCPFSTYFNMRKETSSHNKGFIYSVYSFFSDAVVHNVVNHSFSVKEGDRDRDSPTISSPTQRDRFHHFSPASFTSLHCSPLDDPWLRSGSGSHWALCQANSPPWWDRQLFDFPAVLLCGLAPRIVLQRVKKRGYQCQMHLSRGQLTDSTSPLAESTGSLGQLRTSEIFKTSLFFFQIKGKKHQALNAA